MRKPKENLVPLNAMITPNQKLCMERESEATSKSLSLIVREALNVRYNEQFNPSNHNTRQDATGVDR